MSKVIRDPIHGNIHLDGVFIDLVDSPRMQRLRNIKQNGLCYLVYPAMNSTRFEHSLGVYHLCQRLCNHLGLTEKEILQLKAAALLHDIGHAPFSHSFDTLFNRFGFNHESESSRLILNSEIADTLKQSGVNPKDVSDLIHGGGRYGKILSSEVDVDKMDYLVRDAYYAGVAYGITDVERLLYCINLHKNDVIVEYGGLEAAESLLINRNMMYKTVYRHHTKRIAEAMLSNAMSSIISNPEDVKKIAALDDIEVWHMLRTSKGLAKDMIERLDNRKLFKTVFSEPLTSFDTVSKKELGVNSHKVQEKIAKDLEITDGYLLVDYPESSMNEYKVRVMTHEGLKMIGDISYLAESLKVSESEKITVNIYVAKEQVGNFQGFEPSDYFSFEQTRLGGFT